MMSVAGQLLKKICIEGIIRTKSGLHIGGSNVGLSIGGTDATVVRDPFTNLPYIPGSSLKGKMRSLLERLEGKFTRSGITPAGPFMGYRENAKEEQGNPDDPICKIFGVTPEEIQKQEKQKQEKNLDRPVTRLIVRDCPVTEAGAKLLNELDTDMPYTEVKTEVVIDRITAKATPRQIERVPAGVEFRMELILNIYHDDDEEELLDKLFIAMLLVQNDYLGGKGTRGSGEVSIRVSTLSEKTLQDYTSRNGWQPYSGFEIPVEMKAVGA